MDNIQLEDLHYVIFFLLIHVLAKDHLLFAVFGGQE